MDRDYVISRLREHEPELRAAGIMSLSLFGSVARGDANSDSDVDLMADFDGAKKLSLLGAVGLENKLTDILGVKADLSQKEMLKPDVLRRATREAVLVF
jgi:predicted nucleotidyltransferase